MVTFAAILGAVIVSPLSRRIDTRQTLLLHQPDTRCACGRCGSCRGPAHQTLWLIVILGNGVILGFTLPLHFSLMACR